MALVGEWGFNEGAGSSAADSSGGGRTLSGTSWVGSARTGAGAGGAFTAASGIGSGTALTIMTFMAWVRIAVPGAGAYKGVVTSFNANRWFELSASAGANLLDYYGGDGGSNPTLTATSTFPSNTATHVAVAQSGSSATIFINGTASGTGTVGGSSANLTLSDWVVGGGNGCDPIAGGDWLDEFRVFDAALDATAVTTWMNTPVGGAFVRPTINVSRAAIGRASGW